MPAASDLRLAHRLADVAGDIALARLDKPVARHVKPDGTVVSEVDLEVEQAMLEILAAERPGDSVLSEERGSVGPGGERRWLLDPIDGTAAYLAAARAWGTHVVLEVGGRLAVAVLTRPTEGRRWWAIDGGGAFTGVGDASAGEAVSVSTTSTLERARVAGLVDEDSVVPLAVAEHATWVEDEISVVAAFIEGRVDAVVDEGGDPWDRAPAVLLATEAGGRCRSTGGGDPLYAPCVVYGNPDVAGTLLACVAAARARDARRRGTEARVQR